MYIYYVYAYLRSKDSKTAKAGTPYYIGKGKDKRAWDIKHSCRLPPNKSNIIILEQGLSELGALALERRMIGWYGRKDLGTGILVNLTDGGEGASGYKHPPGFNKGEKNGMYNRKKTETELFLLSQPRSKRGPMCDSEKQKRSMTMKGCKVPHVSKPVIINGILYESKAKAARELNTTIYLLMKKYPLCCVKLFTMK